MDTNLRKHGSKTLYIILVPVILLIILINSGVLQKTLTAVTIDEVKYTALEYNYYYYCFKNDFIEDNYDDLEALGFDQDISAKNQDYNEAEMSPASLKRTDVRKFSTTENFLPMRYNDEISWWEYFCEQATKQICEDYYYNSLAVKDGYVFSEEELFSVEEKLEEIKTVCEENSVDMENYLIAYYGSGMTEEKFANLLTYRVKAKSYKSYLENSYDIAWSDIEKWLAENPDFESYNTVNIRMIVLNVSTDGREGETGIKQMAALENKMNELVERYKSGKDSFEYLLTSFCDDEALVKQNGVITNATKEEVPNGLESWCFSEDRETEDATFYMDTENELAYFVIFDGVDENAAELAAKADLAKVGVEMSMESTIASYEIIYSSLGLHLIDR